VTAQFIAESADGAFVRQPNRFTDRITRDSTRWPVEPGRYRLIWSRACPWAHRAVIVRGLLGLQNAISVGTLDPVRDERGWRFAEPDPVLGITYLAEAYRATDPGYTGRVTVPALVDTRSGRVVTNDFPQITLDLSTEWVDFHRPDAPDLYPVDLRPDLDALMRDIYTDVNNGVYRAGFATSQAAYEAAYDALFARLDALEERLSDDRRYLMGDRLTEACFQSSCPGGSDPFIRWTYDAVGNRLTEARPSGTTSYTYNAADELTGAGSTSYTYDSNGNAPDQAAAMKRLAALQMGDPRGYIEDASFVKVREVSVAYNLPKRLASQLGPLKSFQVQLSGRNLLTLSGYTGLDPEVSNFGNQPIGRNYDVTPYPPSRTYWLSVTAGI